MKKKSLLATAAALSLSLVFTGCGVSVPGGEETTTTTAAQADDTTAKAEDTTTAAAATSTGELSGTITMNGSTSMEKVIKALNGAFMAEHPGVTIELNLTGSGTGIQEAMEGKCDIGNSSRALKDEETGLTPTIIGIDGIAIIVNNENKVTDISLENLEKVYAGEITNWSELGGDDKPIVVIGREDGSGTRDGFEGIVMKNSEAKYAQELESTGSVISAVETTAGAIGYASLANVDDTVRALSINGVVPSADTIKDKTYAIQRPFICAVKSDSTNELVKAYLEFALSEKGQEQVKNSGAFPIN
jgi:phosphate transport system substrate-binding protein